ncbi:MAG TPA: hypothetical protein VFE51_18840 [Verrucomicrobiae bacterium]|nr:hypothetical protein [Verrucomicrobiae bacterium]
MEFTVTLFRHPSRDSDGAHKEIGASCTNLSSHKPRTFMNQTEKPKSEEKPKSIAEQVNEAAKKGQWKDLPQGWVTTETLRFRDAKGLCALDRIAIHGSWSDLPSKQMTLENLNHGNPEGRTPLHIAAMVGELAKVPNQFLIFENLLVPDNRGMSAFHYAAFGGNLAQIPEHLLTKETLTLRSQRGTPLEIVTLNSSYDYVPPIALSRCLDVEVEGKALVECLSDKAFGATKWSMVSGNPGWLKSRLKPDALKMHYEKGQTILHWAAFAGQLAMIPQRLLTVRLLSEKDDAGKTVFHAAAQSGSLNQLPSRVLTQKHLEILDSQGLTSFHYAARSDSLRQIPAKLLIRTNMELQDEHGDTPLHWSAGNLSQVPNQVFTCRNLTKPGRWGWTPLKFAASRIMGCGNDNHCFLIPDGFRDIPPAALWVCRSVVLDGKTVLEHLSPTKRAEVEHYAACHYRREQA